MHPTDFGHSLGAVVLLTFYGWNPLPHPGTAALASLTAAGVLPTAASHSGSSGQDAPLARVQSSASLFWGAPRALNTQGGCILNPRPLSQWVFMAAVPYAARVISGTAGSPCDHTQESDNNSSQGSEWDGASEQGLDEPPADQQPWSFADSLLQLRKYASSALVKGGGAGLSFNARQLANGP